MRRTSEPAFFRLPVYPQSVCFDDGDTSLAYMAERKAVTRKTLRRFVVRWRAIWELGSTNRLSSLERDLLLGKFSGTKLFAALRRMSKPNTKSPVSRYEKMAVHILLPAALVLTFVTSRRFGVTFDLALIRIFVHTQPGYEGYGC